MFVPCARLNAFAVLSAIPKLNPLPTPFALIATVEPFKLNAPVVFPAVNVLAAVDASVVFPVEDSVVNAAVDGVDAPIAVAFMPVAVVVKLPEVMSRLFTPASIVEAHLPTHAPPPPDGG